MKRETEGVFAGVDDLSILYTMWRNSVNRTRRKLKYVDRGYVRRFACFLTESEA